jgi:hypothetical protein
MKGKKETTEYEVIYTIQHNYWLVSHRQFSDEPLQTLSPRMDPPNQVSDVIYYNVKLGERLCLNRELVTLNTLTDTYDSACCSKCEGIFHLYNIL